MNVTFLRYLTFMCPVWNVLNQRMRIQLKAQRASCSLAASSTRKSNISPLDSDWWVQRSICRKYHQCSQSLLIFTFLSIYLEATGGHHKVFPILTKKCPLYQIGMYYLLAFWTFVASLEKCCFVTYYVFAFKSKISRLPAYLTVQMVRFFYKEKESVNAKVLKVGLLLRSDLVYKVLLPKYI